LPAPNPIPGPIRRRLLSKLPDFLRCGVAMLRGPAIPCKDKRPILKMNKKVLMDVFFVKVLSLKASWI
jgi:hypothetical protein